MSADCNLQLVLLALDVFELMQEHSIVFSIRQDFCTAAVDLSFRCLHHKIPYGILDRYLSKMKLQGTNQN